MPLPSSIRLTSTLSTSTSHAYLPALQKPPHSQTCHDLQKDKFSACHPEQNPQQSHSTCSVDMTTEQLIALYNGHQTCTNFRSIENNSYCFDKRDPGHQLAEKRQKAMAQKCLDLLKKRVPSSSLSTILPPLSLSKPSKTQQEWLELEEELGNKPLPSSEPARKRMTPILPPTKKTEPTIIFIPHDPPLEIIEKGKKNTTESPSVYEPDILSITHSSPTGLPEFLTSYIETNLPKKSKRNKTKPWEWRTFFIIMLTILIGSGIVFFFLRYL